MSKELREEILGIVHLVGCQCHSAGWNDRAKGKGEISMEEVERLEKLATDELYELSERESNKAVIEERQRLAIYLQEQYELSSDLVYKDMYDDNVERISELKEQIGEE